MADSGERDYELTMHERDKWAADYAELMAESVETGRKLAEALEALRKLLLAADRTETLDDELLAAADEVRGSDLLQEGRMNTMSDIPVGETVWLVRHNDNSDHGEADMFFEGVFEAYGYATRLEMDPPGGNAFHPAPGTLDTMIFKIERRTVPEGGDQ